jgi:hypothetical protein
MFKSQRTDNKEKMPKLCLASVRSYPGLHQTLEFLAYDYLTSLKWVIERGEIQE